MDAENRALGEAIRKARMRKGLTQARPAEMLDITPIHLKNIEGSRRKPSVPLLFQMMHILDFSVDGLGFPGCTPEKAIYTDGIKPKTADDLAKAHRDIKVTAVQFPQDRILYRSIYFIYLN